MTPQYCVERGQHGDCWRACLATITGIPASQMPNFMHLPGKNADQAIQAARDWLKPRGITIFDTWVGGSTTLETVLTEHSEANPNVAIILSGRAAHADDNHSVVALDGKIVHDPSGAGLSAPFRCQCGAPGCDYTFWGLQIVAARSTTKATGLAEQGTPHDPA